MNYEELIKIRDEISALLLSNIDGDYEAERAAATMAAKQLDQMGSMGGSTRSFVETEIVRLVHRFDDTLNSSLGPWPVSDFIMTQRAFGDAYLRALKGCIKAHKTGRYEPMVAAIESAENLIADLAGKTAP